jgi:hypothetical protein
MSPVGSTSPWAARSMPPRLRVGSPRQQLQATVRCLLRQGASLCNSQGGWRIVRRVVLPKLANTQLHMEGVTLVMQDRYSTALYVNSWTNVTLTESHCAIRCAANQHNPHCRHERRVLGRSCAAGISAAGLGDSGICEYGVYSA